MNSLIVGSYVLKILKHQHGFVSFQSCLSNLLETFDTLFDLIDEGAPVDLFYFDFSKPLIIQLYHKIHRAGEVNIL